MVHDAGGGGQDDDTEGTGGEQQVDPRLDLGGLDVEAGGDDTSLVKTTVELDDDLAGTVVIDDLEFTDVAVSLHDAQELDDDLGGGSDKDLALAAALGIDNVLASSQVQQRANPR